MAPRTALAALLMLASGQARAAEAVTFADLAGVVIEAEIQRVQDIVREGHAYSVPGQQNWTITVNADKIIDVSVITTVRGAGGTRKTPPNKGWFTLDEVREIRNRGGGQGAWSFADGTLSFVRTFPSGAFRAHFAFTRDGSGLTCTATEAFARENGAKPIELESPFGGHTTVINSRQTGSTCVAKTP